MQVLKEIFFVLAAIGALSGALGVVLLRNAFFSVLALVVHLLCLAVLFLELDAQFVAAAQVVVYAGAVMVLYVFVVSYVGGHEQPLHDPGPAMRIAAPLFGVALVIVLCVALLGSGLEAIDTAGAKIGTGFGSPGQIGGLLLTHFLLPFEVASFLLLVAAVGAVMLARHRDGMPEMGPLSVKRALGTGTMAEAVGAARLPESGPAGAGGERQPAGAGAATGGKAHSEGSDR